MKNKSVINTPPNSAVLLPTFGNMARNTLSQLAANHVSAVPHRMWSSIAVTIVTIPRRDRPASKAGSVYFG